MLGDVLRTIVTVAAVTLTNYFAKDVLVHFFGLLGISYLAGVISLFYV